MILPLALLWIEPTKAQPNVTGQALLAVHHDAANDKCQTTTSELNRLVNDFKSRKLPVLLLESLYKWNGERTDADFRLSSEWGEHEVTVSGSNITVTGGFWAQCYARALRHSVARNFQATQSELNIHIPMAAVYLQVGGSCPITLEDVVKTRYAGVEVLPSWMAGHLFNKEAPEPERLDATEYALEFFMNGERIRDPRSEGSGRKKLRIFFWREGRRDFLTLP